MDAHERLTAFLFYAREDLALFAMHLFERDATLVLIAYEMQDPVAKTIVELLLKGMFVFLGLCTDRGKTEGDIPKEINVLSGEDLRGKHFF